MRTARAAVAGLLAACVIAAAGCGGGDGGGDRAREERLAPGTRATLVLDFVPNAVHAGIYRALRRGHYRRRNLRLRVAAPSATVDPLKLVAAGRADLGLADAVDVARLQARGRRVVAVMAVVQRPLGGVIVRRDSRIRTPADLEGRRVGVTGVPSDEAVLDEVVRRGGADPGRVRTVSVGFNGAAALRNRRIDGFTGFWPADAPALEEAGVPARVFRLDARGGPTYPGLVAFASRETVTRRPALVRAFVAATAQGYRETLADPPAALRDLVAENRGLEGGLARRQLAAYLPLFRSGDAPFGVISARGARSLVQFARASGLVPQPPSPGAFATNRFVLGG